MRDRHIDAAAVHGHAADLLCPSALTYLRDLHQAAMIARQLRDQAAILRNGLYLGRRPNAAPTGAPGALGSPIDVVLGRQHVELGDLLYDADQTLGFIAAWYAESALICLRRVAAGQPVHVADIEKHISRDAERSLARWGGSDEAMEQENGRAWGPRNRPDLPELGTLATGRADLDAPVDDAQTDLTRAYACAERAEFIYEHADRDSAELTRAESLARTIPDLLITFAAAVAHAAEYGRSVARGHREGHVERWSREAAEDARRWAEDTARAVAADSAGGDQ